QNAFKRALQLSNIGLDMLGNKKGDVFRETDAFRLSFLDQNRNSHLELGRLDCHGKAPPEPRDEPILHACNFFRVRVTGDDHLPVSINQRVERVEELFLCTALAAEKLDVINQQNVEGVVVLLEAIEGLVLVGAYDIRDVLLCVDVAHLRLRVVIVRKV